MTTAATKQPTHWMIYKSPRESPECPWFVSHYQHMDDGHFEDDHEYGHFPTFTEALNALNKWSYVECGDCLRCHRATTGSVGRQ